MVCSSFMSRPPVSLSESPSRVVVRPSSRGRDGGSCPRRSGIHRVGCTEHREVDPSVPRRWERCRRRPWNRLRAWSPTDPKRRPRHRCLRQVRPSRPVVGLLAPPRTECLDQPSAAQMVLLAALGTARLGEDVQGGSRHRMVGLMFDFQTSKALSSESQTFMIERIKRTMSWLPRAARPLIPRAPRRRWSSGCRERRSRSGRCQASSGRIGCPSTTP